MIFTLLHNTIDIKSMSVSLWCNLKDDIYNDKIKFNSTRLLILKYDGQKSRKRDNMIKKGNYFFYRPTTKHSYTFVGHVISCTKLPMKNGYNRFELVIKKDARNLRFRIKNDACKYFNWPELGNFEQTNGIIKH